MGSLTVLNPGLLTSFQDQGRPGLAFYAIPRSGPLDPQAAALANTLLLNSEQTPVIECHFLPPKLRFDSEATIALTGADMNWQINGRSVSRQKVIRVKSGSVLSGTPAQQGCRAYLAIHGTIETESTFGSSACYPLCGLGGNRGQAFAAGDQVSWCEATTSAFPVQLQLEEEPGRSDSIPILAGPEYDWLTKEAKSALKTRAFSITPESNRMGTRLSGPNLETDGRALTNSLPLLPGFVQLPPSGQCIVVLQDGQTTGGYPRIAFLPPRSLCQLNQIPLQTPFRFRLSSSGSTSTEQMVTLDPDPQRGKGGTRRR